MFRRKVKYNVDYSGDRNFYRNAKKSYPSGEKIRLEYFLIETDTSYRFYLDDERIEPAFENEQYIVEFIMPDHDVTLRCDTENTMENEP